MRKRYQLSSVPQSGYLKVSPVTRDAPMATQLPTRAIYNTTTRGRRVPTSFRVKTMEHAAKIAPKIAMPVATNWRVSGLWPPNKNDGRAISVIPARLRIAARISNLLRDSLRQANPRIAVNTGDVNDKAVASPKGMFLTAKNLQHIADPPVRPRRTRYFVICIG